MQAGWLLSVASRPECGLQSSHPAVVNKAEASDPGVLLAARRPGDWRTIGFALILLLPVAWATASLLLEEEFTRLEGWQVTDYLIHYGSGFVRRGLFGSLLMQLVDRGIPIHPSALSLAFCLAALWLVGLMIALAMQNLSRLNALLIVFSPALLLMFHALEPLGAGRKDSLSLLTIAAGLLLFQTLRGRRRQLAMRLILMVVLPLLTLCHEASLFFIAIPLCTMDLLSQGDRSGRLLRSHFCSLAMAMIPTLVCMVVLAISPDLSPSQINAMCQAWAERGFVIRCDPLPSYFGALKDYPLHRRIAQSAFLSPRFYLSLALTLAYLTLLLRGPLLELAVLHGAAGDEKGMANTITPYGALPAAGLLPSQQAMAAGQSQGMKPIRATRPIARTTLLAVALIALVPSLPMYGLACDFGRWLSISSTILVLQLCSSRYLAALGQALQPAFALLRRIDALLPSIRPSWASFLLVIATPCLRLPTMAAPPLLLIPNVRLLRGAMSWLLS
jgi:hypothetical protein